MHRAFIGLAFAAALVLVAPSSSGADKGSVGVWNVVTTTKGAAKAQKLESGDSITLRIAKRKFWMMAIKEGKQVHRMAGTWRRVGTTTLLRIRERGTDRTAFILTKSSLRTLRNVRNRGVFYRKLGKYSLVSELGLTRPKK